MSITVKLAETEEEKMAIYLLRYDIYINELERNQEHADNKRKIIQEPWDKTAYLLYAVNADEIIGTVRLNLKKDGPLEYEELYDMDKFSPYFPDKISMTTKLLVKEKYRNSIAASSLVMTAYEMYRKWGLVFNFIDTRPHLVRLYQQLGFRFYKENINHPEFGNAIPMVLILNDIEYLKQVRSPFQMIAKKYSNTGDGSLFFKNHFSDYYSVKPLFTMDQETLWENFRTDLHKDPFEVLSFLTGFKPDQARKLLSQLDLLNYDPGDIVFCQNDESEGMYCILEGQVQVITQQDGKEMTLAILNQGEIFGELGFISKIKRTATLKVRTKAKLLILNQKEFFKLESNSPDLALRLLTNLFSILVSRFNEKHQALMEARHLFDTILSTTVVTESENMSEEKSKGSYVVDEFADTQGELDRLRFQAKTGFGLEKKMFDHLGISSDKEIIDVGCGPAFFANEVYNAYKPKKLHGLEIAENLIEIANRENSHVSAMSFTQGSVYQCPFEDNSFDLAYSRFVFQHLDQPQKGVNELKRIIRPGGKVIIEDIDDGLLFLEPTPPSFEKVQSTSEKIQKDLGGDRLVGRKLFSMMQNAGFSKVSIQYLPVNSSKIGMESFIFAAFGFKFDHLKRSGAGDEEVAKAKEEFFALAKDPNAFGSLMLVFTVGTV
ncbi:MAG: GNAT family N-acetyltransferase [Leptospira sp.]|nr:GNAT family N-acetyltransferase [Leptospira sp.]